MMKNDVKEFVKGLPKANGSHVLSMEEQEMIEGGACEGVSCKNSCLESRKKTTKVEIDADLKVKEAEVEP